MVDYIATSYVTSAYSKFLLGEFLDGYSYEGFYIVADIHIFVFIKIKCFSKNFFHLI